MYSEIIPFLSYTPVERKSISNYWHDFEIVYCFYTDHYGDANTKRLMVYHWWKDYRRFTKIDKNDISYTLYQGLIKPPELGYEDPSLYYLKSFIQSWQNPSFEIDWIIANLKFGSVWKVPRIFKNWKIPKYSSDIETAKSLLPSKFSKSDKTSIELCLEFLDVKIEEKTSKILSQ